MSINHSPSIVTNGLLFYYDMNNKLKSFIGKPITNLYYATNNYLNGNGNHWVNSGAATFNDNDTSLAPPTVIQGSGAPTGLPSNLRTTSATVTTVGNQECGMNITTVSASTQYTMSVWFYQTSCQQVARTPFAHLPCSHEDIQACCFQKSHVQHTCSHDKRPCFLLIWVSRLSRW